MPELAVTEMPVGELVPYAGNAKEHPESQVDEIAASIAEFGNCDPIGVWHDADGNAQIVEGHGRVLALRKLGIETAPVIFLDHLTDEQRRAYSHVHNQTTLSSGFDMDALCADMAALDFDWESLGFSDVIDGTAAVCPEDDDVAGTVASRCSRGDVWRCGEHVVMCGDSTNADDMATLMRGGAAQMLVTDPPYGVSYVGGTSDAMTIENDDLEDTEFVQFLESSMRAAMSHLEPGSPFYVWHADAKRACFLEALGRCGMRVRQCLVWVKNAFVLGRQDYQWRHESCLYGWKDGAPHYFCQSRRMSTVMEHGRDIDAMGVGELRELLRAIMSGAETTVLEFDKPLRSAEHPTMKPVDLIARLVSNSSRRGDVVLDAFGGSGSTLIACERLGRKCRTMELDPHYCDVIVSRWEETTGETAVLRR